MNYFRQIINTLTLIALLLCGVNRLSAQGTAFTYQGRLNAGTNPANGIYDATFALFSVASGAGQVGTTQTNTAVAISNGLFTVTLDFGANFPGADRWLEIGVRTNGGGAFTTLAPRQKLTPTPYAIFASSAGAAATVAANGVNSAAIVDGSIVNVDINAAAAIADTKLATISTSGKVANSATTANTTPAANSIVQRDGSGGFSAGNITASFSGNGANLTSLNASQLAFGTVPSSALAGTYGNAVSFTNAANSFTGNGSGLSNVSAASLNGVNASNFWQLGGNNVAVGQFLGSTNNQPLELKVNGARGWRLEPNATSPNVVGGYSGNGVSNGFVGAVIAGGGQLNNSNRVGGSFSTVGGGYNNVAYFGSATVAGGDNNLAAQDRATVSGGFSNRATGLLSTVGGGDINLASGQAATVPGGSLNEAGAAYAFAAGRRAKATNQGAFVWADSQNADFASTANNQFLIRAGGGVGIGTTNPTAALDVAGTARALAFAGNGAGLTNLPATQLTGTLAPAQLVGTYGNALTFNNPANSFTGNGGGLTNLNALTVGGLSAGSFWKLLGNAGTTSNNFLGTTDNQALELRVNGARALRIKPNANGVPNMIGGSSNNYAGTLLFGVLNEDTVGATIGGGDSNHITSSSVYSTIGGGRVNVIAADSANGSIGGGQGNYIGSISPNATISGGSGNVVAAGSGTVGGGYNNFVDWGNSATIGGGSGNRLGSYPFDADHGTIGGGNANFVRSGTIATIGGGSDNKVGTAGSVYVSGATIGGGQSNSVNGDFSAIGGGQLNSVETNSQFSTIGGGHFNSISGDNPFISSGKNSTISGGESNTAQSAISSTIGGGTVNKIWDPTGNGAYYHTIGGGISNVITSHGSLFETGNTIGGGVRNAINYQTSRSTIGGGIDNGIVTDSPGSTIGGGVTNFIDGVSATIAGGNANAIVGYTYAQSSIGGGGGNKILGGSGATIAGGLDNAISDGAGPSFGGASIGGGRGNAISQGRGTTISGGYSNVVNGVFGTGFGTIPGGLQAKVSNYGQMAYASGQFAATGDAQTSVYVARSTTANATPTDLFLDGVGASARMVVPVNSTWSFDILLTGRTTGGSSAGYQIRGVIENNAGTTALVGSPTVTVLAEDVAAWDATAAADDPNDALVVRVTGAAATTIRWVATVRTVEVNF